METKQANKLKIHKLSKTQFDRENSAGNLEDTSFYLIPEQPLTIRLNTGTTEDTNKFTYDGSEVKTVNITPSAIGAAPTSHASSDPTIYGVGSTTNYGHVRIQNGDLKGVLSTTGTVAGIEHEHSQYALTTDSRLSDSRTPKSHASSSTTYGVGTTSNYGHVKISNDDVNTVASADGLVAGMDHSHGNYMQKTAFSYNATTGVLTINTAG